MQKLVDISEYAARADATGKAKSLAWLKKNGVAVPQAFVFVPSSPSLSIDEFDLSSLPRSGEFAVRSSAKVEDGASHSYAGQFDTILGVSGHDDIRTAIAKICASGENARVSNYQTAEKVPDRLDAPVHVIVQRMIEPQFSGVAFSQNPLTGLNEIVIEAIEGRGDALVDSGVTPDRFVWRGKGLISSTTLFNIPSEVIAEVAQTTARLAKKWGAPIDLEWAYDGQQIWWLQCRPITGLENVRLYSNRISREVMPGMIRPMIWSINIPIVNGAWIEFLEKAVGDTQLLPEQLAKSFAFRSYFNMGALGRVFEMLGMPPDALEVMLGLPNTPRPRFSAPQQTLKRLPKLIGFGLFLLTYERRFKTAFHRVRDDIDLREQKLLRATTGDAKASEILEAIKDTFPVIEQAALLNIIMPILANVRAAGLRKQFERAGIEPMSVDLVAGRSEFEQYDPKAGLKLLGDLKLGASDPTEWSLEQKIALSSFMKQFGHLSDSTNDLSVSQWREQPDFVVQMAGDTAVDTTPRTSTKSLDDIMPRLGWFARKMALQARRFQLHREAISYEFARGYGAMRAPFLHIGTQLVEQGILHEKSDIFFLEFEELENILSSHPSLDAQSLIAERKAAFEAVEDVDMPDTIYADTFVPLPASRSDKRMDMLRGVGSSIGQAKGPLRVLKGQDDFGKVQTGDIIVIPFSDVAWTPVFAKAAGVISQAGGMLSHSSIVAREYGIPCIVSANGAMRLPDGHAAIMDGASGQVVLLEENAE